MKRRTLLKTGIFGGALLAAGGYVTHGTFWGSASRRARRGDFRFKFLTERDTQILGAIFPVLLAGTPAAADPEVLAEVIEGFDQAVAGLPLSVQGEVRQLMVLLSLAPTRTITARLWTDWRRADPAEIEGFLTIWRNHRKALWRSGYDALRQLTLATWYGNPKSWPSIGYQGPPPLS